MILSSSEEKARKMMIKDMIALCNIFEYYEQFNINLIKFKSEKNNLRCIYDLEDISNGKYIFNAKKIKKFYEQNKSVIDEINRYSSIASFICSNYKTRDDMKIDCLLDYFYEYLMKHKEKKEQILSLLQRLNELGFDALYFYENLDFTSKIYKLYTNYDHTFIYMDNIEVLPNYQNSVVEYKTTGSNYKIFLDLSSRGIYRTKQIFLNSLLFDLDRLPDDITEEYTLDKIIALKEKQKDRYIAIQNSVDLSVGIDDLYKQFNSTTEIVEKLKNVENKDDLKKLLEGIRKNLDELQTMSNKYDESISKEHSIITKEKLQAEKKRYLDLRRDLSIDSC